MPLTLPAAPTPPTIANPAAFEAQASAMLAWWVATATAMNGSVLLASDISQGSNANGDYLRLSDGTQICRQSVLISDPTVGSGALFWTSSDTVWTYPASFVELPRVAGTGRRSDRPTGVVVTALSNSVANVRPWVTLSLSGSVAVDLIAIGRWK